jgi:hypothetical protein
MGRGSLQEDRSLAGSRGPPRLTDSVRLSAYRNTSLESIGVESLVISAATWLLQSFRKLYRVTSRILGVDDKDARVGIECCAKTSTKRPTIARKQSFFLRPRQPRKRRQTWLCRGVGTNYKNPKVLLICPPPLSPEIEKGPVFAEMFKGALRNPNSLQRSMRQLPRWAVQNP